MVKISKKKRNLLLKLGFVVLLVAITLVVLFVSQKDDLDFNKIKEYFQSSNPVWIVGAFGCMLLFIFFEALSVFFIARFFGSKPNIISCTAYSSADAFYSAITPTGAGGQPAEVFYMARDGMSPGKASFAILLNTIGYTAAIFAVGLAALCIDPGLFGGINSVFAQILVIAGAIIQLGLLGLYTGCMFFGKAIIKIGNGIVRLFAKIRLVKNPERWYDKIKYEVAKYSECRQILKEKPLIFLTTLVCNILQRTAQTLIPCFVCLAVYPDVPFLEIFALQAFVLFGYNSTPLPGGVGAYEFLFMSIYAQLFPETSIILLVLMISRLFSFYFTILLSGVITLTYHMVTGKKSNKEEQDETVGSDDYTAQEQPSENGTWNNREADGIVQEQSAEIDAEEEAE